MLLVEREEKKREGEGKESGREGRAWRRGNFASFHLRLAIEVATFVNCLVYFI